MSLRLPPAEKVGPAPVTMTALIDFCEWIYEQTFTNSSEALFPVKAFLVPGSFIVNVIIALDS